MTIVYIQPQPKFGPYRYSVVGPFSASKPEGSVMFHYWRDMNMLH